MSSLSPDSLDTFLSLNGPKCLLFVSLDDGPSQQLLQTLPHLQQDFSGVSFRHLDVAAASSCLLANCGVSRHPTINFYWGEKQLGQLIGVDMPLLLSCLRRLVAAGDAAAAAAGVQQELGIKKETEEELHARLSLLIRQQPVMLFIKGKKESPFCRFSKALLLLLQQQGVKHFGTFDVFDDQAVREGLKKFSDWPTYPQVYVNGELIGGLDVLNAMVEDGTFKDAFPPSCFADSPAA